MLLVMAGKDSRILACVERNWAISGEYSFAQSGLIWLNRLFRVLRRLLIAFVLLNLRRQLLAGRPPLLINLMACGVVHLSMTAQSASMPQTHAGWRPLLAGVMCLLLCQINT